MGSVEKALASQHTRTILFLLLAVLPATASGMISAPTSHAQLSTDGSRILVMVSPDADYENAHPSTATLPDGRVVRIRDAFSKSGCYDATTLVPLWQVDWFSLTPDLLASADFADVARRNRFGLDSDWGLAFYHNGRLVRRYDCKYLLTGLRQKYFLPFSTWDWHTQWYDEFELKEGRVSLSTARRRLSWSGHEISLGLQEFYVFDMATGDELNRRSTGMGRVWTYGFGVAVLVSTLFAAIWWRRHKRAGGRDGNTR
jgi:hypothetical protein